MDNYNTIILLALLGFIALAFILLAPVYFFLRKQERASEEWTPENLARRTREQAPPANGSPQEKPEKNQ